MSAVPAARYLADFGADGGIAGALRGSSDATKAAGASAKLDEAFAHGVEAGKSAAQAACDAKIEAQRTLAAQQLAAERQTWASETGETLANALVAGLQELEARIADTAARILKPFVAQRLHDTAIAELQAALDALVAADRGAGLHISGPTELLDSVRRQLEGKGVTATYTPGTDCDVRIVADQSTLETRLEHWMAKLGEALR